MGPALALNLVSQEKILYFHFAVNFVAKLFVSLFVLPSLTMFNVYFQIWKSVILLRHSLEERKCITRYSHILGIRKKERKKEKGRKGGREEGRKEGRKERKKERKKERRKERKKSRHLPGIFNLTLAPMKFHQLSDAGIPNLQFQWKTFQGHLRRFLRQTGVGMVFGTFLLTNSVVLPGIRQKQKPEMVIFHRTSDSGNTSAQLIPRGHSQLFILSSCFLSW